MTGLDAFAGACLALIVLTSYRFSGSVGIGEVGLSVATAGYLMMFFLKHARPDPLGKSLAFILVGYLALVLTPVTVAHYLAGTVGTSLRDLAAFALSLGFVSALALANGSIPVITRTFLIVVVAIVSYQYFYGTENAWYGPRFTGGAKNPNQLALNMVVGMMLATLFIRSRIGKLSACAALLFFGIASLSDAFVAFLIATLCVFVLAALTPRKYIAILGIPMLLGALSLVLWGWDDLIESTAAVLGSADEGAGRPRLLVHGALAWLDTLLTVFLGNGAGSFSGAYGPFGLAEAHNTPIDILAVGGIVGLVALYAFPLRCIVQAYRAGAPVALATLTGLVVFSLFHFVARHPIFWFGILAVARHISARGTAERLTLSQTQANVFVAKGTG